MTPSIFFVYTSLCNSLVASPLCLIFLFLCVCMCVPYTNPFPFSTCLLFFVFFLGIVGGIPSPNHDKMTKYLSKLSDVQINGYMSQWAAAKDGVQAVYQFRSSCAGKDNYPGPHPWAMYIGSYQKTYDDSKNGMNLQKPKEPDVCFGQRPCKLVKNQWPGNTGVFDSPHYNGAGNNCQRFFQGHRGGVNPYQCYNPRVGGQQGQRCFSHGSSCRCKDDANNGEQSSHPQALNLQIFVKPPQNYVGYRDQRFYNK